MELEQGRQLIIAGHSHVFAFQFSSFSKGAETALVRVPKTPDDVFGFATLDGPYNDSYWQNLVDHAADRDVLILWLGSQHLAEFLFRPERPFDFLVASHPEIGISRTAQIVPESLVRTYQMKFLKPLEEIIVKLNRQPRCRVYVGATPPPKGDDLALRDLMIQEAHFQKRAEMLGLKVEDISLTSRTIRLKFWLLIDELLREITSAHKVNYIGIPTSVIDREGFLQRKYWENDVGHGNSLYGSLYLQAALTHIRS